MSYTGITQPLPTGSFGEISTVSLIPRIQTQFTYNINSAECLSTTTGSGTVTSSPPFAVCSTTAATSSSAMVSTLRQLHYQTGQGNIVIFTSIFTTGVAGSTQIVGAGNAQDGLFFGYNGASFGINRRDNGSDNWVAQTSWNQDKMNGTGSSGITLDPTKGNVYKIQFQWLGFGNINFFVENPVTGQFVLVHNIQYPNANIVTSVVQPSFPLMLQASNTTNNTNIVVKVPSIAAFREGEIEILGLNFSVNGSQSVTTTPQIMLTVQNNSTFAGITNKKSVDFLNLSLASGNTTQLFSIVLNGTIGGTPVYNNVALNQSCASFDIAGTTITGGRTLFSYILNPLSNISIDLTRFELQMEAGNLLSIVGTNIAGGAQTAYCAINWIERY